MSNIEIHTDGSVVTNPGPGAWAAVIVFGDRHRVLTGYEPDTTNGRMELQAALEGLRFFKGPQDITVYSDATYVVDMFNKGWVDKWAANDYRKTVQRSGALKPIKNRDLVMALDGQNMRHRVTWEWVRGHDGNYYNEVAHQAAYNCAQEGFAKEQALKEAISEAAPLAEVIPIRTEKSTETPRERIEGYDTSESMKAALLSSLDSVGNEKWREIPDPPMPEHERAWAVYKRRSAKVLDEITYIPMSPSSYSDGGRAHCIAVAQRMNRQDSPISLPHGGRGKYVAMPYEPGYSARTITDEEDAEITKYMKDDGKVIELGAG